MRFDLPDLSQLSGVGTPLHGAISTYFVVARLPMFDYATLRTGQLAPSAWSAYAEDTAGGSY